MKEKGILTTVFEDGQWTEKEKRGKRLKKMNVIKKGGIKEVNIIYGRRLGRCNIGL